MPSPTQLLAPMLNQSEFKEGAAMEIPRLHAGTPECRRVSWAMFIGGFACFAMLYGLQPLMPMFAHDFHLSPAAASGVLSAATGTLAFSLLPASIVSEHFGRKSVMAVALAVASVLTLLTAMMSDFSHLLISRALFGIVLAGLPAVAMAYLSEEIDSRSLGFCMGLYIAGNALGGMSGRLLAALVTDASSWRVACLVLGAMGVMAAVEFWRALPASRHFVAKPVGPREMMRHMQGHWNDKGLPWLFLIGFMLMGCFVSLYNYLGFRLAAAPFNLRPGVVGLIFSLYFIGMFSSALIGRLSDRLGRRNVLWVVTCVMTLGLLLTLTDNLWVMVLGIALFTFGFFASHAVASSWVGQRVKEAKSLATAFYLFAYYLGSSVLGTLSGLMWDRGGWNGVAALLGAALVLTVIAALKLHRLEAE